MRPQKLNQSIYEIKISGIFDQTWRNWLNADSISDEIQKDGTYVTTIRCSVKDQADLRGLIRKIWNLNLIITSLLCVQEKSNIDKGTNYEK